MLRLNLLCKKRQPPLLVHPRRADGWMDGCEDGVVVLGGGKYDGDSKQQRQTECLSLLRSSGQEE